MGKNSTAQKNRQAQAHIEAFAFGDPEPVLGGRGIWDYYQCTMNQQWIEPPVPFDGLAKSFRANPHHESAINFKSNILLSAFIPTPYLKRREFGKMIQDYLVFGNAAVEKIKAKTGRLLELRAPLMKHTRCAVDTSGKVLNEYVYLQNEPGNMGNMGNMGNTSIGGMGTIGGWAYGEPYRFPKESLFLLFKPDINQDIYGQPEYLSALQSIWLNEAATLFRRKYYLNGSHAGFILYTNDAVFEQQDLNKLRDMMARTRGPGNFQNILLHAPNGKKDSVQLIPIGEVSAKDEFASIKNTSRDDILAAHRVPPVLLGIVPNNAGGLGDVPKAAQTYMVLEGRPLQNKFLEINEEVGQEVVKFEPIEKTLALLEATAIAKKEAQRA